VDKASYLHAGIEELVKYCRKPDDLWEEIAFTVNAIIKISGKSMDALPHKIPLVKVADEIQRAIQGDSPPTSDDSTIAHLDYLRLKKTESAAREEPVDQYPTLAEQTSCIRKMQRLIEQQGSAYRSEDLRTFLEELETLFQMANAHVGDADRS
jgi:hypothetical protein